MQQTLDTHVTAAAKSNENADDDEKTVTRPGNNLEQPHEKKKKLPGHAHHRRCEEQWEGER